MGKCTVAKILALIRRLLFRWEYLLQVKKIRDFVIKKGSKTWWAVSGRIGNVEIMDLVISVKSCVILWPSSSEITPFIFDYTDKVCKSSNDQLTTDWTGFRCILRHKTSRTDSTCSSSAGITRFLRSLKSFEKYETFVLRTSLVYIRENAVLSTELNM